MTVETSRSDLPLARLAADLAAYDKFMDHGQMVVLRDDVRYALSLIAALRDNCEERDKIIQRFVDGGVS